MSGLIKREDIASVRDASHIEDVVGEHVTLKSAGVGSLKGLCPFHDERTPSFHVRPHLGFWHCFGCGEGGDVISFVEKINHLPFSEAVEYLAARSGIALRYEAGEHGRVRSEEIGQRQRLVEINRISEEFFQEQLSSREAQIGRDFLAERGFTRNSAQHFGVGYAPKGWDNLLRHLRGHGYTEAELAASGVVSQGARGVYDRFRGRLIWPIRDLTGSTVGFGARKLTEDDQGPKYLNTPETALYKKSQVLYGIDLAKKEIARSKRVVVVEGYTDVMAAHAAGIEVAVASCGTAFGSEHTKIVRRLLGDSADPSAGVMFSDGTTRGAEVIFTFDGDAAGRKAALRAFEEDQSFASQTFVAIEKTGIDPCDLRLARGDEAVRQLIASRVPLFEFVIRSMLNAVDLGTAEGRVNGLRGAVPVVARIRDHALRREYARELAGWLGMNEAEVIRAVLSVGGGQRGVSGRSVNRDTRTNRSAYAAQTDTRGGDTRSGYEPRNETSTSNQREDPITRVEREALEAVLQRPFEVIGTDFDQIEGEAFSVPSFRAVHDAIRAVGGIEGYGGAKGYKGRYNQCLAEEVTDPELVAAARWNKDIIDQGGEVVAGLVTSLAVAPLPQDRDEGLRAYVRQVVGTLIRIGLTKKAGQLRADLQRMATTEPKYQEVSAELIRLEQRKRSITQELD